MPSPPSPAEPAKGTEPRRRFGLPRTFAALSNRDYRLLWIGTLGSFTAMQMQIVARGYLAYALTGSAVALGVVSLARGLPQMIFTLFGGVVADRVKKRNLLLVTQSLTGFMMLVTAVLVSTGTITIWQLVVLGFLEGSIFAFNMPTRQAFLPELVEQKDLMNAIALNNAGMNFTRIFGPALAGAMITIPFIGLERVFYFMAACYLLPVLMIFQMRPRFTGAGRKKAPMLEEFRGGIRYIARHEVLGMLLIIGLVPIMIGFTYQTLLPVFASDRVLNVGASGLGLMSTCVGAGALVGSLAVATMAGNLRRRGLFQLITGAAFGLSLVFFALSSHFYLALLALTLVGLSGSIYQSLNSTLLMSYADPQYYGRVMSVNMLGFSLTMIMPLPIGVVVDVIGAPLTVAINGALITAFVLAIGLLVKSYRRLEAAPTAERPPVRVAGVPG
jgi:predicted MFS family arabinose efflux permease